MPGGVSRYSGAVDMTELAISRDYVTFKYVALLRYPTDKFTPPADAARGSRVFSAGHSRDREVARIVATA